MHDADVAAALLGRGGRLQQLDFADEADMFSDFDDAMGDGGEKCALVEALLFLFGWGRLSLPIVNWLAKAAISARAAHEELTVLASIGDGGKFPNNMRRDLMSHFCRGARVPRPLAIDNVPTIDNVHRLDWVDQHMLSLNELLECL